MTTITPTVGRRIHIGLTGFFYAAASALAAGAQRVEAEVIHVWSDTCVNLRTAEGQLPTSVLVVPPDAPKSLTPSGYYFVPHVAEQADPMKPKDTEAMIQAAGKTAPRVTPADVRANIVSEHYFTAADGAIGDAIIETMDMTAHPAENIDPLYLLTFCVLVLRNGFTVTGTSACASPENFDAAIGRKLAREDAERQVWPLMGYALRERLAAVPATFQDRVKAEKAELDERLAKLDAFVESDAINKVPPQQCALLGRQLAHMRTYSEILAERIALF